MICQSRSTTGWRVSRPPTAAPAPDPRKRPFIVIDPRAGHGPGIGSFKADSEIGVAMQAGHPCYFVGFLPRSRTGPDDRGRGAWPSSPSPRRSAAATRRPKAGRWAIGNCQAGWALLMAAAIRPEVFGPLMVAGTPVSTWAGVPGKAPMRYLGGLLGGSWLTAMTGDLGAGKFDGAWLVSNFQIRQPCQHFTGPSSTRGMGRR